MKRIFCYTNEGRDKVLERFKELGYISTQGEYDIEAPMTITFHGKKFFQTFGVEQTECGAFEWLYKNNPKYKKGDLFQIKPNIADFLNETWLDDDEIEAMKKMVGKPVTLSCINDDGNFVFREDRYGLEWLEEWVNPIKEVMRPAKVGEFVKVVAVIDYPNTECKVGDIIQIVRIDDSSIFDKYYYGEGEYQYLCGNEYAVLEGYEDCDYVKKFEKEFVPYLFDRGLNTNYGIIGEDTPFIDAVGRKLKVGDTVEIYRDGEYRSEKPIVKRENSFVMGIESCCNKDGSITNNFKIIKKRSYEEIEHGEMVENIKYIKSIKK